MSARRPVLIVEGPGDRAAVPRLLRELAHSDGVYDFSVSPNTKMNVEIAKLMRDGELERYVEYAVSDTDSDSVIIFLDCEDFDPIATEAIFNSRIVSMSVDKPVVVILVKSEFETLFLFCIRSVAQSFPDYEWLDAELDISGDIENIRNAKGRLSKAMKRRGYKPTRDQEKFITALDYELLAEKCPSFVNLRQKFRKLLGLG